VPDAICPNTDCAKQWTQTFLCDTLTSSFRLGPYKTHRETVLFDREKARLPDTQDDAKRFKDALLHYEPLRAEESELRGRLYDSEEYKARKALQALYDSEKYKARKAHQERVFGEADAEALTALRSELRLSNAAYQAYSVPLSRRIREISVLKEPMRYARDHYGALRPEPGAVAAPERKKFVMRCPQATCEGFLSSQYKCGLCDVSVCAHCHVTKTAGHECDPDLVETIKQIRKEAKPCPKCASLISKIDGCDQMWCTQCSTPFSWTTGAVEKGVIHNPHYFQYLRARGEAPPRADNPGFGCAAVHNLAVTLMSLSVRVPTVAPLIEVFRRLADMRAGELMTRRRTLTQYAHQEWRRGLRVERLAGVIDQAKWTDILQRREKEFHKDTAWVQLLEMYTTVSIETLATLTRESDAAAVECVIARLATIKEYTLAEAAKIAKVDGCVVPKGLRPPKPVATAVAGGAGTA